MERNKKKIDVEKLDSEYNKNSQKLYHRPNLINLGKMQKTTLGKAGSAIDSFSIGEEP